MELRGKRLLILGGSRISCEIVRCARKLGIVTGVTDWYPYEKSPAKQLADEAYYVSTSDIDAMLTLVNERHFDGVVTGFTDSVLPYYAELCQRAGLPAYGTKEQFEIFIDKERYKELLNRFGIPTIPEYRVRFETLESDISEIEFPVIVKPTDGSGSRGITVCKNSLELVSAIEFARESSKSNEFIVEKYLDCDEATVFWVFAGGQHYVSLLGNRLIKHNQEGQLPLPAGYTYPATVQQSYLENIAPKMKAMLSHTGIKDGMMFMQCKIQDNTCLVYDVGYRLTGSLEYKNLEATCSYNPLEMLVRFALTGKMGLNPEALDPWLNNHYAYNVSILCRPGIIGRISGLDTVRELPGVIDVVVAHPEGDEITNSMLGRLAQITVRILGIADSIESMKHEMLQIQSIIEVESITGENMVLPGLDESDFYGLE